MLLITVTRKSYETDSCYMNSTVAWSIQLRVTVQPAW